MIQQIKKKKKERQHGSETAVNRFLKSHRGRAVISVHALFEEAFIEQL